MTGLEELRENTFVQSRDTLKETHGQLMRARLEFDAVEEGHSLDPERRLELIKVLDDWDDERRWFMVDNMGGVSLFEVCEAAGTRVGMVRAHYQEFLELPFNFRLSYSRLWGLRNAGKECGRCAGPRCEETPGDCAEGREAWERVAGSDSSSLPGEDRLRRAEADRWDDPETPEANREATS